MTNDLLRQRRNLIVICCILIFLKFSEIQISKFAILGIEFSNFKNPESIYLAIWIGWAYFLIRYYQYFIQEGFPNFKSELSKAIETRSTPLISNMVFKYQPKVVSRDVSYQMLKNWGWIYYGSIDNDKDEHGKDGKVSGVNVENYQITLPQYRFYPLLTKCFLHIVFNRSAFSDYILPILLAFFVVYYCSTGWQGSLVRSVVLITT